MLVAIADVALVLATAGALVLTLVVAGAMILAGASVGTRMLQRRTVPQQESMLRRRA
jgi:hypothetical protein